MPRVAEISDVGGAEDLLRRSAPQVLGVLVRRHGRFDLCEDAVQEALLAAATVWPQYGLPEEPVARLVTVVGRKLTELWRSEHAGRQREETVAAADVAAQGHALPADIGLLSAPPDAPIDDTLELLVLGAHHALSEPSQIALTLRAVGGLTTAEIARAFLVPEATMAQRRPSTPRAATFTLPDHDRVERLAAARHVLYLVVNEGYPVSAGWTLTRAPFGC